MAKRKTQRIAQELSGVNTSEDHLEVLRGEHCANQALRNDPREDTRGYTARLEIPGRSSWIAAKAGSCTLLPKGEVGSRTHT